MTDYKFQARRLRAYLSNNGVDLNHSKTLEAVAALHGARNWQTLSSQKPSELKIMQDRIDFERLIKKHGCEFNLEDIVHVVIDDENDCWVAIRQNTEVIAAVMSRNCPGKLYFEGEAANCYAPASILEKLTPTNDENRTIWRESAKITQLVAKSEAEGSLSPWTLYKSNCDLHLPTFGPHVLVAVDQGCTIFDITDGEVIVRKQLSDDQRYSLETVGDEFLCSLDSTRMALHAGRAMVHWLELGDPGYKVLAAFTELGGLVAYTGIPWYMLSITDSRGVGNGAPVFGY